MICLVPKYTIEVTDVDTYAIEADSPEDAIKQIVTTKGDQIVVYDEHRNVLYEPPGVAEMT